MDTVLSGRLSGCSYHVHLSAERVHLSGCSYLTMCLAWIHEQVHLSGCSYHVPGMDTMLSGCI